MDASADVVRLDDAQLPAAAALGCAFVADPFFAAVLPNPERRAVALPTLLSVLVANCQRHGLCHTTAGAVRGVAAWNGPGNEITEEPMRAAGCDAAAGNWAARWSTAGMDRRSVLPAEQGAAGQGEIVTRRRGEARCD